MVSNTGKLYENGDKYTEITISSNLGRVFQVTGKYNSTAVIYQLN